ncbi:MAG: hypothetical protein ABFS86_10690 [Planctomycetota bacterium]
MNRPLTTIFLMGVIGTVMLTMFGSFFVGKVGGAEKAVGLASDLREVFHPALADREALKLKVVMEGEVTGLLVSYPVAPALAKKPDAFKFHRQRVVNLIYGRSYWRDRAKFVTLRIALPGGGTYEQTYRNPSHQF